MLCTDYQDKIQLPSKGSTRCVKNLDEIHIRDKAEHKNECDKIKSALNCDDEVFNKIKSTILVKKPSVKFSNLCGLEKEKKIFESSSYIVIVISWFFREQEFFL